jgi:hypothetical protein
LGDGQEIPEDMNETTYEEFREAFVIWNERTTTSPSGQHLGHYKILTKLKVLRDAKINISEKILNLYYQVMSITSRLGKSLKRWKHISTCMIEKIKGCPRIDKLRVIQLYEADYNLLLKIIWSRRVIWNAHNQGKLHPGQSGSRPGRNAADVIIQNEMKHTYARITKTVLGTIDNDAKSCYDRIPCNVAMLVSKYFGTPTNYCKVQADHLKN